MDTMRVRIKSLEPNLSPNVIMRLMTNPFGIEKYADNFFVKSSEICQCEHSAPMSRSTLASVQQFIVPKES